MRPAYSNSTVIDTLASVTWLIVGVVDIAVERISTAIPWGRNRTGYRNVAVDEDAQILRFEDED